MHHARQHAETRTRERRHRLANEAARLMAEGGFRHVPVVDPNGVPLGMVSARDALGQDMVDLEREMKHLEELEASIGY